MSQLKQKYLISDLAFQFCLALIFLAILEHYYKVQAKRVYYLDYQFSQMTKRLEILVNLVRQTFISFTQKVWLENPRLVVPLQSLETKSFQLIVLPSSSWVSNLQSKMPGLALAIESKLQTMGKRKGSVENNP